MKWDARYRVLETLVKVNGDDLWKLLEVFVTRCVVKPRQLRWLDLMRHPAKVYAKFNQLWNSLEASRSEVSRNLSLPAGRYVYYCMDESGYLMEANTAFSVAQDEDGILWSEDLSHIVFCTHEGDYYSFTL